MIDEYSYGHLMILEISSDQQKRPAGLIKMGKLKSGDLLISGKRDSCGRREILIKSYNFMCCIYMFDSLMVRFRDGCGSICLFFRSKSQEWTV